MFTFQDYDRCAGRLEAAGVRAQYLRDATDLRNPEVTLEDVFRLSPLLADVNDRIENLKDRQRRICRALTNANACGA